MKPLRLNYFDKRRGAATLDERVDRIARRMVPVVTNRKLECRQREGVISDCIARLLRVDGLECAREVPIAGGRADLLATDGLDHLLVEVKSESCPDPCEALGQILYYREGLLALGGPGDVVMAVAFPALKRLLDEAFLRACARQGVYVLAFGIVEHPPIYTRTPQGVRLDGYPEFWGWTGQRDGACTLPLA